MILFFRTPSKSVIATEIDHKPSQDEINELCWLYGDATLEDAQQLQGFYVGPRREMITPWSTNAVEITQNMSLNGISRIEEYFPVDSEDAEHDPMLQRMYNGIGQDVFTVNHQPEPIKYVDDLEKYNEEEGLALSEDEMAYLHKLEKENGRPLTDSEIFGFAQINSEHCRHKIFGGQFIIDGKEMESSLFNMIKKTTNENPNKILSAYKDNVAFSQGPVIEQFAPADQTTSDFFQVKDIESVISLKAETHNFPTTVEPFNGAATGTGGEIRDRMGGGVGSWPIAGTACYMTAYPRLKDDNGKSDVERDWEDIMPVRKWLYQTPEQILIKASNGASDFGNKFGQPLITGSVLTFEHEENGEKYAYDKVIMLAGGVGYGKKRDYKKGEPQKGNKVVVVGGDNYRIGLGGGSVSSVDTGRYSNGIELNAVQRANPEMQKRAVDIQDKFVNAFTVIIQFGAILSVICLYWKRFFYPEAVKTGEKTYLKAMFDFYARLVVGTVPAVVLGLAFNDFIESNLGNVQLVGWMLVIGGIFMLFCDKIFNKGSEQTKLTYKRALIIGFIQCIAMIPGVSRSMSTIVGGMSQRLTRKAAAEFSFFLAVPTMFGATCLEVYKLISHGGGSLLTQGNNLFTLILGSVVAFIVAILAIKFFINYVTKYGFAAFGWYRIVVGLIIIICGLCGVDMQMVD